MRERVQRRGDDKLALPFSWQIALWLLAAVAAAFISGGGLWWLLGRPDLTGPVESKDRLELVKIALAVAAGTGGVIALVVAYRKQRLAEASERRESTRLFSERFGKAVEQLGSDRAVIRLAGAYAMAGLGDDWVVGRQSCIDVLCGYIRMAWTPPSTQTAVATDSHPSQAFERADTQKDDAVHERQVRHTILGLIAEHLRDTALVSWQGHDLDFTEAVLDGADFTNVKFSGGKVTFTGARFVSGWVAFRDTEFSGADVTFTGAEFVSGRVDFAHAQFADGRVDFAGTEFSGGEVTFTDTAFTGGRVDFAGAEFSGGEVTFTDAKFTDPRFPRRTAGGSVTFTGARFTGTRVDFTGVEFSGGRIIFGGVEFSGGEVNFDGAMFTGGWVNFIGAEFSGGKVLMPNVDQLRWKPIFDRWTDGPPEGLVFSNPSNS
ncbi:pentapeptide repeat-containing protein [Kibdelosporangium lantanae]|uniref:Pentapeptide repeat-containing protein n=1 Tax=Kibdelosporangium lantanae TaxID=1497396 RepID=A0ABW3M1T5_9PSEU